MRTITIKCAIIIAILCTSCNNDIPNNPIDHFDKQVNIIHSKEIDLGQFDILRPIKIFKLDNWFVFKNFRSKDALFCYLKDDFSCAIKGGKIGQGPEESTSPAILDVTNDTAFVFDFNLRKISYLEIEDTSLYVRKKTDFKAWGGNMYYINDNRYVMTCYIDSMMFKLTDNNNNIISEIPYPNDGQLASRSRSLQNSIYLNSFFAVSPDKTHFAFGSDRATTMGFGRFITTDSIKVDTVYIYSSVKIGQLTYEGQAIVPARDSKLNTLSITCSDKYALFLYSGKDYTDKSFLGNTILIYTYIGTPTLCIKTDKNLSDIFYDVKLNTIYGIAYDPDPQLVEYDLNGILD